MKEEWRPVVGYEDAYEVSNLGRIRSVDRMVSTSNRWGGFTKNIKGKILSQSGRAGYRSVCLSSGSHKTHNVHILVLTSFVGPAPDGHVCCHGDGNKENNRVDNLRWGTVKENCADTVRHGNSMRGEKNHTARLNTEKVIAIKTLYNKTKATHKDLASLFDVHTSTVKDITSGRTWGHV